MRPAANEPVGHRFELGTSQHELLAGFVAAVDYMDSLGWDAMLGHERALGERFLAGPARPVELYGLRGDGRPRADLLLQRAELTPEEVATSSPSATSRSGTGTTTPSRR